MFKRLLVLLLLVVAATSASTPAHAETLTVSNLACYAEAGFFSCDASVSGGTGTYTSFVWGVATGATVTYYNRSGPYFARGCISGYSYSVSLTVTDSAGATASQGTSFYCPRRY